MFETAVLSNGPQTKRMWATCLGFTGQALLIGGMLLGPLIWPQALPNLMRATSLAAPAPPPPPPPGPHVAPRTRSVPTQLRLHVLTLPSRIPPRAVQIEDPAEELVAAAGVQGGVPGGVPNGVRGVLDSIINSGKPAVGPPEPAVKPAAKPPEPAKPPRVTVMQMAEPIQRVNPIYPPLARQVRVSGKVELMGVLGTDGRIHELKVVSGHPLLVKAAVDAVMQWLYKPTILNGQAVEVSAPITVNFILH